MHIGRVICRQQVSPSNTKISWLILPKEKCWLYLMVDCHDAFIVQLTHIWRDKTFWSSTIFIFEIYLATFAAGNPMTNCILARSTVTRCLPHSLQNFCRALRVKIQGNIEDCKRMAYSNIIPFLSQANHLRLSEMLPLCFH